jgi:hypothetical protein
MRPRGVRMRGARIVQRMLRRVAAYSIWTAVAFALYMCFISTIDGPEFVAGALVALGAGAVATVAWETAGRGLLSGARHWYAPAAAWPVDFVTDCALLARLLVGRALRRPIASGEIRTLRLRAGVPSAVAGFWLSSTPGGCVVGAEGRTLRVHCLSGKPSRVERLLASSPREHG